MQSVKIESKEMPTHNKINFSLKITNGYDLNLPFLVLSVNIYFDN